MPYATLLELLRKKYAHYVNAWDHYHYLIHSPISLDDLARIEVILINQNGFKQVLELKMEVV